MTERYQSPLTFSQMDIYLDQLKHPNSPLYNVGGYIRLGNINVEKLMAAHAQLVTQVDIFGLRIHEGDNEVYQTISHQVDTDLQFIDFSSSYDRFSLADEWINTLFQTPIDYLDAPLFRSALIKLNDDVYRYIGFAHHLMTDGWGFANWAAKLGDCYHQGKICDASPWLQICLGELDYGTSKKYLADKDFWQQQLKDQPDSIMSAAYQAQFDSHFPVPSARETLVINAQMYNAVKALASLFSVSIPQIFMAAVILYLARVYQQNTVVLGVPAHNRRTHALKQMIGIFTSVSPLKINLADVNTLEQLVGLIGEQQKRNLRHQRYPIGHMITDSIARHDSRVIYDVAFNYLKLDSQLAFDSGRADLVYVSHGHETTPLMINLWDYGEQHSIELQLDYNLAFFKSSEIQLVAKRLVGIVSQLLDKPQRNLNELDMLSAEDHRLLEQWQHGPQSRGKDLGFHQLFEQQVELTPKRIAVSCAQQQLSYMQLNHRANQLAHFLIKQGLVVQTQDTQLVGIHLERSIDMLIAMLAVVKAGMAYVPLDPSYPAVRLNEMIEHSGMRFVLCDNLDVLSINQNGLTLQPMEEIELDLWPQQNLTPESLLLKDGFARAYVIYTSGSTGKPKGVEVAHQSVVNLLNSMKVLLGIQADDRLLAVTSMSFDMHVTELFLPLICGAMVVVCPADVVPNGQRLAKLLQTESISILQGTPSMWRMLLDSEQCQDVKLAQAWTGGEMLLPDLASSLLQLADRLWNLYGPTETTVYASAGELTTDCKMVDIGSPVGNCDCYVLNREGKPQPIGVFGELFVGGLPVAKGYLHEPELTAERFVIGAGQQQLYRSGDLVRWLPSGRLECAGRIDEQVKIRGYRVELGEIENRLHGLSDVSSAVVVLSKEPQQLVAFVVLQTQQVASQLSLFRQWRKELQTQLPTYMVPSLFVLIEQMPLTPSGKIDRNILLAQDISEHRQMQLGSETAKYQAPTNPIEQTLAEQWQMLLGLEKVSIYDDFFSAGGSSLLATRAISLFKQEFGHTGYQLSIASFFAQPTIADIAAQMTDWLMTIQVQQAKQGLDEQGVEVEEGTF